MATPHIISSRFRLADLAVDPPWRTRGIGRYLVQHAVVYARLAGCDRLILATTDADEAAGVDRFHRRFGWQVFTRETQQWEPVR